MRSWRSYKDIKKESEEYSKENFVVEDVKNSIRRAEREGIRYPDSVNQTQLTTINKLVPNILDFFRIKKNSKKPIVVVPIYTGNVAQAVKKAVKGRVIGADLSGAYVRRANEGRVISNKGEDIQGERIPSFKTDMTKPQDDDTKALVKVSFEPTPLLASLNRTVLPNLGASGGFILITKKRGDFDVDHPKSWGPISDTRFLREYGVQVRTKIFGRGKERIEGTQFLIADGKNKNKYLFDRECFESVENRGDSVSEVANRLKVPEATVKAASNRYKMLTYRQIKLV